MPSKPQLATAAAAQVQYVTWDTFVQEATAGIEPFRIVLPGDTAPTEIACPTGAQMEALAAAQRGMDDHAAALAIFGDKADRIMELTAGEAFPVRAKLFAAVMTHYGQQIGALPE